MSETLPPPLSARSRAPINAVAEKWWDTYGSENITEDMKPNTSSDNKESKENNSKTIDNKSTDTSTLELQRTITSKLYGNFMGKSMKNDDPKVKVLKKWREDQAKARYEHARQAVINSLKEKFCVTQEHRNIPSVADTSKADNTRAMPTIIITGDNVEETSNSNVNRDGKAQKDFVSKSKVDKVEVSRAGVEDISHARRLQMGQGGELAQWRLVPRGSRAASAEDELRGLTRIDMPVCN
ncbi:unnamed protein product [Arctia plantaginis]|uniref:Uncharacterized protein n=1 Tax=Arctia plantaginis TaxID=874455 RepID=A0A8S0ZV78_ARCPL|nr:unnamed protein product [Arctia plantaginis]